MRPTPQLPELILQVSLCLDPSPPWDSFNALFIALICYLTISTSALKPDTGIGFANYVYGTAIGTLAVDGFYLLLLGKPLTRFKYIGDGNRSVPDVWWKKYFNVVCIPHSPRLIGWSHQVCVFNPCYRSESGPLRFTGGEHPSCPTAT